MRLNIELVPASSWYTNVRSNVSERTWLAIARTTFSLARNRCQICDGVGPRHPVECHEQWAYDDTLRLQTLLGTIALCPRCHEVKHIGRAIALGGAERAVEWLCHVNGLSPANALTEVRSALALHAQRSLAHYHLDLTHLSAVHGVSLTAHGIERGHVPNAIDY